MVALVGRTFVLPLGQDALVVREIQVFHGLLVVATRCAVGVAAKAEVAMTAAITAIM
jgi:hypothetical protein